METSEQPTLLDLNDPTLSPEASPVKMSVLQEGVKVSKEKDRACGESLPEPFAYYDPDTSLWRIPQACLVEGLDEFLGTWLQAGMMRNGRCYELPTLERITLEAVYFSSLTVASEYLPPDPPSVFWPTPDTGWDGWNTNPGMPRRPTWRKAEEMWRHLLPYGNLIANTEWLMGFPINWSDLED